VPAPLGEPRARERAALSCLIAAKNVGIATGHRRPSHKLLDEAMAALKPAQVFSLSRASRRSRRRQLARRSMTRAGRGRARSV